MAEKVKVARASAGVRLRRSLRFLRTRARELRMIGKALLSTKHPVLVHIIPMRRCNLDCGYCNEYDDFSKPVPLDEMKRRLDLLADMGTSIITISGGEPLLHPELEEVIRQIRKRGMIAGMITNGFLLSVKRIQSLSEAGLEHLQISIDNVTPDEVSKKSLKTLDSRLEWLAEHAVFQVNINSVLGSGVKTPEDALTIAHRAVELGFTSTVGIIHDHNGQLKALEPRQIQIFEEIMELGKRSFSRFNDFQHNVARAKEHTWRCRSGARYLYICEDGLVHWCSQQRGYPGIPLAQYTPEMREREYLTDKYCGPRCTISCVQQVAMLDNWRDPQTKKPMPMPPPPVSGDLVQIGSNRNAN
ncbi:MAG TPA: radical SAM protein [Candidatus Sulfotelmatobacter sp.]|jgi:MoaA/NifB/PqqE/SkfB family radical SAM enzyme|nr:radical SAM protein [Candidatus Sulfotelmatobacter sp.]